MIKLTDWAFFGRKTTKLESKFNIATKYYSI
jgi:hypothetical protein